LRECKRAHSRAFSFSSAFKPIHGQRRRLLSSVDPARTSVWLPGLPAVVAVLQAVEALARLRAEGAVQLRAAAVAEAQLRAAEEEVKAQRHVVTAAEV